jgi:aerobic carbon-monoxide dehydrogenase medium subunit
MISRRYVAPRSLNEALLLLADNPNVRILAGGHSLLVEPSRSRLAGVLLVDLRKIDGLASIELQANGNLRIGPMTTLAAIADSELIGENYSALAEAARSAADAQARNRATVGGSIATADPEADLPAPILALAANVQVVGPRGARVLASDELFTGPYQSSVRPDEVITAVTIPAISERSGTAYQKFRHPATLGAICGVAANIALSRDGSVASARVAITGAAQHATRLFSVERLLINGRPSETALATAAEASVEGLAFRGDLFASDQYRRHLARVLTERALKGALERATVYLAGAISAA